MPWPPPHTLLSQWGVKVLGLQVSWWSGWKEKNVILYFSGNPQSGSAVVRAKRIEPPGEGMEEQGRALTGWVANGCLSLSSCPPLRQMWCCCASSLTLVKSRVETASPPRASVPRRGNPSSSASLLLVPPLVWTGEPLGSSAVQRARWTGWWLVTLRRSRMFSPESRRDCVRRSAAACR